MAAKTKSSKKKAAPKIVTKKAPKKSATKSKKADEVHKAAIYVNGNLIGFHADGAALANRLREKRRMNELNYESNVFYNDRTHEVFINTDGAV